MKKFSKNILTIFMLIVVLFNFILCNSSYVYAENETVSKEAKEVDEAFSAEKNTNLIENGAGVVWDILGAIFGTIASILVSVVNLFPMLVQLIMSVLAYEEDPTNLKLVTIGRIVFNEVGFVDANYFDFDAGTSVNKAVKESVAKYYYIFRLVAVAINLGILMYIGIRMAISTVAQDRAKYKMMLIGWGESIIILFLLPYLVSIIFNVGTAFENVLIDLKDSFVGTETNFEEATMQKIFSFFSVFSGWEYVLYSLVYWYMVSLQIKFFLAYMKRFITLGFLLIISPFISVVYALDKAGDGKAQSFERWLRELVMNIVIQPIHAAIYLVYMITAGAIAEYSIFFALLILTSMTKIEKMVLNLFNTKPRTLHHVGDQRLKQM